MKSLSNLSGIPISDDVKVKDPYWYTAKAGRIGGQKVYQLYGRVCGDAEKRKEKWFTWWNEHGQYQKHPIIGVRKHFARPRFSTDLAEFAGIMVGDGGISDYQITITLNR